MNAIGKVNHGSNMAYHLSSVAITACERGGN